VKFKVDENLPGELSQLLRDAGWDSLTIEEQKLGGANDPHIAHVCAAEQRILVTFDRGFANIRAYPPSKGPGMIIFRLKSQDKQHVLAVSARLIEALKQRELRSELWIVHENRMRIRAL
jgi:predicted nuclease of predicted toxin-antitoxin system